MKLREAAQEALEYIEQHAVISGIAIRDALRAALAEDAMQRLTDVQQEMEPTIKDNLTVEPVAWRTKNATPPGGYVVFQQYSSAVANLGGEIEPLYTQPPQRKPLTLGQLFDLYNEHAKCQQEDGLVSGWLAFACAIERAHGIGGEE